MNPSDPGAADSGPVPVSGASPVTVAVSRRPRPGAEADLEQWWRSVIREAAAFPGHLGAELFRPAPPDNDAYVCVFRFATAADLDRWNTSPQRTAWLQRAASLTEGDPGVLALGGMEPWFALPGQLIVTPRRWKMALTTGSVIYVIVLALSVLAGPFLAPVPLLLRLVITTAFMSALMTWVVMPMLTRLLAPWLYADQ